MTTESEVRAASVKFYEALNAMANGDGVPMEDVWVTGEQATAQHPVGGRDRGFDDVIASFRGVSEIAQGGDIRLSEQVIDVGADLAVETGVETGTINIAGHTATLNQRVTNVYRLTGGGWKLQVHHTDVSTQLLDILEKLQSRE